MRKVEISAVKAWLPTIEKAATQFGINMSEALRFQRETHADMYGGSLVAISKDRNLVLAGAITGAMVAVGRRVDFDAVLAETVAEIDALFSDELASMCAKVDRRVEVMRPAALQAVSELAARKGDYWTKVKAEYAALSEADRRDIKREFDEWDNMPAPPISEVEDDGQDIKAAQDQEGDAHDA